MSLIRIHSLSFVLAAALVTAGNAAVADPGPMRLIERTTGEFLKAVAEQRQAILEDPDHAQVLVERIVRPHIDVDTAGRWMLGKHWRKGTPEQRQRFLDELRKMLVRSYATALAAYQGDVEIRYVSERVSEDGKSAIVRTQIPRPGAPRPVDVSYRLHRSDGEWKVFDVAIEGVSMVTTYRSTFRSKLDRQGLESVIQELAALNQKAEASGR